MGSVELSSFAKLLLLGFKFQLVKGKQFHASWKGAICWLSSSKVLQTESTGHQRSGRSPTDRSWQIPQTLAGLCNDNNRSMASFANHNIVGYTAPNRFQSIDMIDDSGVSQEFKLHYKKLFNFKWVMVNWHLQLFGLPILTQPSTINGKNPGK